MQNSIITPPPSPLTEDMKMMASCMDINGVMSKRLFEVYFKEDALSAVEMLKKSIEDLYHRIGKAEVWRAGGSDVVCDMCEDFMIKKIDKAFPICKRK